MTTESENTTCPTCETSNPPGTEACSCCGKALSDQQIFKPNTIRREINFLAGLILPILGIIIGVICAACTGSSSTSYCLFALA